VLEERWSLVDGFSQQPWQWLCLLGPVNSLNLSGVNVSLMAWPHPLDTSLGFALSSAFSCLSLLCKSQIAILPGLSCCSANQYWHRYDFVTCMTEICNEIHKVVLKKFAVSFTLCHVLLLMNFRLVLCLRITQIYW
jgi:hypothetical protein